MIEKEFETLEGDTISVEVRDDEDFPVVLACRGHQMTLTHGSVKALGAWLKASILLQRWC